MNKLIILTLVILSPFSLHADLNIFACEPEWAALATELGGDKDHGQQRNQCLAGPTLYPGETQPDFKGATR